MRLLIVSHGHPDFHPGGGELVAHRLYQALRRAGHDVFFLGVVYPELGAGADCDGVFAPNPLDPNDLAIRGGPFDFFTGRQGETRVTDAFVRLVEYLSPDILHFHHFLMIGLDAIRLARMHLQASCRIVLTLHEYWAICPHNGQMLRADGTLCHAASIHRCTACLPARASSDFFLREQWVKTFLKGVDAFICPSHFLRERYLAWGLPEEKLVYVPNGVPEAMVPVRGSGQGENPPVVTSRCRFGFFGQMTATKGVEVLLRAARRLHESDIRFELGLHGTLALQDAAFRARVESWLADAADDVTWFGPYAPEESVRLMADYDWILIPSIWWENAPLVVEEALAARRPIICSDLGGLAEKVEQGRDGIHVRAADPWRLAAVMEQAATDPDLWSSLHAKLREPVWLAESVAQHLALYHLSPT